MPGTGHLKRDAGGHLLRDATTGRLLGDGNALISVLTGEGRGHTSKGWSAQSSSIPDKIVQLICQNETGSTGWTDLVPLNPFQLVGHSVYSGGGVSGGTAHWGKLYSNTQQSFYECRRSCMRMEVSVPAGTVTQAFVAFRGTCMSLNGYYFNSGSAYHDGICPANPSVVAPGASFAVRVALGSMIRPRDIQTGYVWQAPVYTIVDSAEGSELGATTTAPEPWCLYTRKTDTILRAYELPAAAVTFLNANHTTRVGVGFTQEFNPLWQTQNVGRYEDVRYGGSGLVAVVAEIRSFGLFCYMT